MSLEIPNNLPTLRAKDLLISFPEITLQGEDFRFQYITADSRKCKKGLLFCLYREFEDKASEYIKMAYTLSSEAILLRKEFFEQNTDLKNSFPGISFLLYPENPRQIHGEIASFCLGYPSEKLEIIAVTGTNGKTSVTSCLYRVFLSLKTRAGLIGTIYVEYGNTRWESANTTPDPSQLQLIFFDMVKSGIQYVFMEASSHGLKLNRMDGTSLRGGIFTNLTPDHLDFHGTMEDYLQSKFRLFELLQKSRNKSCFGIVSMDSPGGMEVLDLLTKLKPSYTIETLGKSGTFRPENPILSLFGTEFRLSQGENLHSIQTKLLGYFNFVNISLVFMAAFLMTGDPDRIIKAISELEPVKGRFEIISSPDKKKIGIVDYAHTPDALENVLKSLKEIPHSKLICVFGCGGDRDRTKRPVMGEIACKYSDFVYITSDNPRTEDPISILNEIESGISGKYTNYTKEPDRRIAIRKSVEEVPESGFLLVAGKGHENYQIIGTTKYPFSDVEELKKAFSN